MYLRLIWVALSVVLLGYDFPSYGENLDKSLPADELSDEVHDYITAADLNRVGVLREQIVDEVYAESQIARAKLVEIHYLIDAYVREHGSSPELQRRVSDLEDKLDDQVESENRADFLREAFFVSATAITGTTLAGALGTKPLQNVIEEFAEMDEVLSSHQRRMNQSYFLSRTMPTSYTRPLGPPISAKTVVERDLKALGLKKTLVQSLGLSVVSPRAIGYTRFEKTNLPGLSFASMEATHEILFGLTPSLFGSVHAWVRTRALTREEFHQILVELVYRDISSGGRDFAILVDPETREAFPTRLTMDQIAAHSRAWRTGVRNSQRAATYAMQLRDHLTLYSLESLYDLNPRSAAVEKVYRESLLGPADGKSQTP